MAVFGMGQRTEVQGVATMVQVRSHTQGGAPGSGGNVGVSTREVMTFRLAKPVVDDNPAPPPVSVEVLRRRFHSEIGENDEVRVCGIWRKRGGYLRALEVENITAQRTFKGARWG